MSKLYPSALNLARRGLKTKDSVLCSSSSSTVEVGAPNAHCLYRTDNTEARSRQFGQFLPSYRDNRPRLIMRFLNIGSKCVQNMAKPRGMANFTELSPY